MNITMQKKSDNTIGYDFIRIVECRLMRKMKSLRLPLSGEQVEGYVYEYEYECLAWNIGEKAELMIFMEGDMSVIREHYCAQGNY